MWKCEWICMRGTLYLNMWENLICFCVFVFVFLKIGADTLSWEARRGAVPDVRLLRRRTRQEIETVRGLHGAVLLPRLPAESVGQMPQGQLPGIQGSRRSGIYGIETSVLEKCKSCIRWIRVLFCCRGADECTILGNRYLWMINIYKYLFPACYVLVVPFVSLRETHIMHS